MSCKEVVCVGLLKQKIYGLFVMVGNYPQPFVLGYCLDNVL
jgi:hypothetical protein